ncbi:MAG: 1-deoxy-D-xylulose-5-phosphate synthase, partial [Gammaproteobacteria bacterium]
RVLDESQLLQLANELRIYMLYSVGQTGGHFGAGLGVVELTLALHAVYQTPEDRLVWDVGHQAYPHKILTGRKDFMNTLRQKGGLKGFPSRSESPYDSFGVGHSSTSISAALGMALASELKGESRRTVAVIGDGAMTAGMAFEALNHASHCRANLLVILNDNRMSISENVGGLSNYFARVWASRTYNTLRESGKKVLENMPAASRIARRAEEHVKGLVSPGTLFEELGFNYIGPVDGHDLPELMRYLERIRLLPGPQLLHVITQKGKGFKPAEDDPIGYHALNKIEPKPSSSASTVNRPVTTPKPKPKTLLKYSDVFGQWLCDMAVRDERLIGITPAMREGSGMVAFSHRFPERYYDVAIAEQHSVTLAAGLACEEMKPVVAIYSTFLQRAYDQLIHDVALQNLDVLFAIDRSGLVGEDGPTHAGSFDLTYLRCVPNMVVMAPSDESECRNMLYTGYVHAGPAAVRYPRGRGPGAVIEETMTALPIGKALQRRAVDPNTLSPRVSVLAFGSMVTLAMRVAAVMDAAVYDMRFVKPLDEACVLAAASESDLLVTMEENVVAGGAGSAVLELLAAKNVSTPTLVFGLPDQFVEHGTYAEVLQSVGLSVDAVLQRIAEKLAELGYKKAEQAAWCESCVCE